MFANEGFNHLWPPLLVVLLFQLTFQTQGIAQSADLTRENELLLELRLDNQSLGQDILGYQRGEDFLLSLDELTDALGFSITVDPTMGTAVGWFISKEREFSLDVTRANVISAGNSWPIEAGDVVLFEGGLYVDANVIEKWFPLRLSTVIRDLYLDIESTEMLPIQQRMNRRSRVITGVAATNQEPQYPLQETPYRFVGPHITNLRLGYSTTRQGADTDPQFSSNYASLSRGDLGWMTSTLSLAGRSNDALTAARLKLERSAFNGPLGLSHIEVGDVNAGGFRGVLLRGGGGGSTNGNRPNNEIVTLEGSQLPDWDIELYQNKQLIAAQTTGQDGRYFFEDIPLQFGENRFEIQFFGPNGEFESREEFYYLGPDMLAPGRFSYQLSAVENGHTVFDVNQVSDSIDRGSGIYASSLNFGLTPKLTAVGNISSRQSNGERIESGALGVGFSNSLLYGSLQYATTSRGQSSVSTSLRTRLRNTNISLEFRRFFEEDAVRSEQLRDVNSQLEWQSSVDVTSSIFNVPIKFEADIQEQENSTSSNMTLGTTVSLRGTGYLSSSIWYSNSQQRFEGSSTNFSAAGGQISFNTTIRPWTFRVSAIYSIRPDFELRQLSTSGNLRIDSKLNAILGVRQSSTSETITYDGGINWLLKPVTVSTRVSYDSNERWTGLISLGTTLVKQPRTLIPRLDRSASVNSGRVEVRVYEDEDDGKRQPYARAGVNTIQTWRKATTDEDGKAYLSSMPSYRQVDIELDESTLEDNELRSTNPGVSVISRPGSYAVVDFPLVRTAELEGYISVTVDDDKLPVSRALVSLKSADGEVVTQTRTAFDGFYLFEGVEPGDYQISLEDTLDKRAEKRPEKLTVTSSSGIIAGLDYSLRPAKSENAVPTMFAQEQERELQQESSSSSNTLSVPTLTAALPVSKDDAPAPSPAKPQAAEPDIAQQNAPQADNGTWFVQIGAYDSRDKAQATWDRLSRDMQTLQRKTARYMPFQSMTRLLVGPGRTRDAASSLCEQLKTDNLDCLIRQIE